MSDEKLRDFIQDNASEFDDLTPSQGLWDKIEGDLPKQRRMVSLTRAIAVAASVVVIVCASMWVLMSEGDKPEIVEGPAHEAFQPIGLADLGEEMAEVEVYYVGEVNARLSELSNYDVDEEILNELELLKEEFESLKQEMGRGANRQAILEAMIDNYRLRLDILEDLLEELKEDNNEHNNQDVA